MFSACRPVAWVVLAGLVSATAACGDDAGAGPCPFPFPGKFFSLNALPGESLEVWDEEREEYVEYSCEPAGDDWAFHDADPFDGECGGRTGHYAVSAMDNSVFIELREDECEERAARLPGRYGVNHVPATLITAVGAEPELAKWSGTIGFASSPREMLDYERGVWFGSSADTAIGDALAAGASLMTVPDDTPVPPEATHLLYGGQKDGVRFYGFRPTSLARVRGVDVLSDLARGGDNRSFVRPVALATNGADHVFATCRHHTGDTGIFVVRANDEGIAGPETKLSPVWADGCVMDVDVALAGDTAAVAYRIAGNPAVQGFAYSFATVRNDEIVAQVPLPAAASEAPRVGSDGARFLVVWVERRDIRAALADVDGTLGAATTVAAFDNNQPRIIDVTFSQDVYFVLWHTGYRIYMSRIARDGTVLAAELGVATRTGIERVEPAFAVAEDELLVVWRELTAEPSFGRDESNVMARRFLLDGRGVGNLIVVNDSFTPKHELSVGWDGGAYVVVWNGGTGGTSGASRVFGAAVTTEGEAIGLDEAFGRPALRSATTDAEGRPEGALLAEPDTQWSLEHPRLMATDDHTMLVYKRHAEFAMGYQQARMMLLPRTR